MTYPLHASLVEGNQHEMLPIGDFLAALCLRREWSGHLLAIFSVHLDESGTDGLSPYVVVAGAVATPECWDKFEDSWGSLLTRHKVSAYHWKEFNSGRGEFSGWGRTRREMFVKAQEKIIKKNTKFRMSVGVDKNAHSEIKAKMKGVTGFREDSDYSLCLRFLMFHMCEALEKSDPDFRLTVLVEDGPWAAGAAALYQDIKNMTRDWNPAKHAHRLSGFGSVPKGKLRSLEAADYLAGSERSRMISGKGIGRRKSALSVLLGIKNLDVWYQGMIREEERRKAYWEQNRSKKKPLSWEGRSS